MSRVKDILRLCIPKKVRVFLWRLTQLPRSVKNFLQVIIFRRMFLVWERMGFHVTPSTFGSTIPELAKLPDDVFEKRSEMVGIDMRPERQVDLLATLVGRYGNELGVFEKTSVHPWDYYLFEWPTPFPPIDAQILYCMTRWHKPRRIYEIGSGRSTTIMARAVLENTKEGHPGELVAIEPYPNSVLRSGFPGLSRLVDTKFEDVPMAWFSVLEENDIVFIDSSHHLRIANDVQYLYLELLPRLPRGVLVHIHDIFFPNECPREWIKEWKNFPNEQYLLQAFMAFNRAYEILWASQFMHIFHRDLMQNTFKGYRQNWVGPGSLWIKRVG